MKKKTVGIIALIVGVVLLWAIAFPYLIMRRNLAKTGNMLGVEWYNETDTEFTITTAEELTEFAKLSDFYDFSGQTVKLGADIVVNEGDAEHWKEKAPSKKWRPIENFAGTFDGQGHTISGVYGKGFDTKIALFVDAHKDCVVRDFKLVNSFFETKGNEGAASIICGGGGTFQKIYSDADFSHRGENCGGIAGFLEEVATLEECWYDGDIMMTSRNGGGIVADISASRVVMKHCLFSGTLESTYNYQGSIYDKAEVRLGGIAGRVDGNSALLMEDCLASGVITVDRDVSVGAAFGYIYPATKLNISDSYVSDATYYQEAGTTYGDYTGYPLMMNEERLTGEKAYQWTSLDFENYWVAQADETPILKIFSTEALNLTGVEKQYDTGWYNANATSMIDDIKDLYGMYILSGKENFDGVLIKLNADVTSNEGKVSEWAENAPENLWFPIRAFAGTFDGQGHTISGLYGVTPNKQMGLFAQTAGQTKVKNLRLVNSYFESSETTGAIVGSGGGNFESIYTDAIVKSTGSYAGGIIGAFNIANGSIKNCWSDSDVTVAKVYAGGMAGSATKKSISFEHCLNTGTVTSEAESGAVSIGGIVGVVTEKIEIDDCLNTGMIVSKTNKRASSIAGALIANSWDSTITNTYATIESSKTTVGSGNYYGMPMTNTEENLKGVGGYQRTTLDFDKYWTIVSNGTPILQTFANKVVSNPKSERIFAADISWYDEEKDTFVITTKEQLLGFTTLTRKTDFAGKTVKLGADIALNSGNAAIWAETAPLNQWYATNNFSGTFDGQGHTISGLYTDTDTTAYNGMFSVVLNDAIVRNFRLTNSYVEGGDGTGSVVGRLKGTIDTVYSSAIVNGNGSYTGGIVGSVNIKEDSTITNCWFDGIVTGADQYVGGILGANLKSGLTISHCLNTGTVASTRETGNATIGGILGVTTEKMTMADCLSTGEISTIKSGNVGSTIGGFIANAGNSTITATYADTSIWSKTVGTGKPYGMVVDKVASDISGNNGYYNTTLDFKNYWAIVEDGTPILKSFASTVPAVPSGERAFEADISWYDESKNTFTIKTREQFYGFTVLTNRTDFKGKTVKLGANITYNSGNATDWANTAPVNQWIPTSNFSGTFDGQGHTINGLYINNGTTAYAGMFAVVLNDAVVKNISLENSYIEGGNGTGSVAGRLKGTIDTVYSNAIINGSGNYIGGIVGAIDIAKNSTIKNCWFDGEVSAAKSYVGGIVGASLKEGTKMSNCLNTGNVISGTCAGGILGVATENMTMNDCMSAGELSTSLKGDVGSVAGAFIANATDVEVEKIYTTSDSGKAAIGNGSVKGEVFVNTEAELIGNGGYQRTHLDFNKYWAIVTDGTPILKSFADSIPVIPNLPRVIVADTDWYDAKAEKFTISTPEELYGFAKLSADYTFKGQTIELANDIAFNRLDEGESAADWATEAPLNQWISIANFEGTFNGKGCTISGLYLNSGSGNAGMFGVTKVGSLVANFKLKDSYICGGDATAAIVGNCSGDVSSVYTNAIVKGKGYVGGIVGYTQAANVKISNCWNDGPITCTTAYCGGIAGAILKANNVIKNCLNTQTIAGGANRGGLCGVITEAVRIEDCLTVGSVSGSGRAGSVIGDLGSTLYTLTSGTLYLKESIVIKNVYAETGINGAEIGRALKHNEPTLMKVDEANLLGTKAYASTALTFDRPETESTEGAWVARTNKRIPVPKCFAESSDYADLTGVYRADTRWYSSTATEHEIDSVEDLLGLATLVDNGTDTFKGDTVYLKADLTMNQGKATDWATGTNVDGLYVWTPIGVCDNIAFEGTFDGGGHCLSGFYYKGSELKSVGLFAETTTDTVIKNFSIVNSYFENNHQSYGGVGAVVGIANGVKLIDTVYSEAIIKSTYSTGRGYTGGIVGCIGGSAGTIQNCWNVGDVTSTGYYVGGILGINLKKGTVITNCMNTGALSAYATVGNILGTTTESMTLNQCLAAGETSSTTGNGRGAISGTGYSKGITMNDVYYIGTVGVDEAVGKHEVGDSAKDTAAVSVSAEEAAASGIAVLNTNANWYWEAGFDYPVPVVFKSKVAN